MDKKRNIGESMEFIKVPNEFEQCNDLIFKEDSKTLKIFFSGDLDLYMVLEDGKIIPPDQNTMLYFDITKENNNIYYIFNKLYNDIIEGNISDDNSINYKETIEYKKLVDVNNNIIWISDDGPWDSEDKLQISKLNDNTYRLIFTRNDKLIESKMKYPLGIGIRIRNARSKYKPFNLLFMDLYNNLQKIDYDKKCKVKKL